MARVNHKPGTRAGPGPHGQLRGAKMAKHRRRQKMEVMTNDKDSQHISFTVEPPPGYTFIPAGNPQLTAALKDFAKKGDFQIHAVTTTPHAARHELSREVHRVGYHFPTAVVAQVCTYFGIQLTSRGTILNEEDFFSRQMKNRLGIEEKKEKSQVDINTEAKQIIQDLFPKIPDKDLFQIIKTAFQLGDHRVGTAEEIPLVRRAQLSVVAHIRHVYTKYDKLLRQLPYNEARHTVEAETLQKLVEWRGDEAAANDAVNDALNDAVVVISEDEDTDTDIEEGQIISEKTKAKLASRSEARYATQVRPLSPIHIESDDENVVPYRVMPQPLPRREPEHYQMLAARREQDRNAAWERARQAYRAEAAARPTERVIERILLNSSTDHVYEPLPRGFARVEPPRTAGYSSPYGPRPVDHEVRHIRQPSPTYVRGADGLLYERISRRQPSPLPAVSRQPVYVSTRPSSPVPDQPRLLRRNISFDAGNGSVVPSIEGSQGAYSSPSTRRPAFEDRTVYRGEVQTREPAIIDLTNSAELASKRPRLDVNAGHVVASSQALLDHRAYQPRREPEPRRVIDLTSRAEEVPRLRPFDDAVPSYDQSGTVLSSAPSFGRSSRIVDTIPVQNHREHFVAPYRAEVQPEYISLREDGYGSSRRDEPAASASYHQRPRRVLYDDYNAAAYVCNRAAEPTSYIRREVPVESCRPMEPIEVTYPDSDREIYSSHVRREYVPIYVDPAEPVYVSRAVEDIPQRAYTRVPNASGVPPQSYESEVRSEAIPKTTYVRS